MITALANALTPHYIASYCVRHSICMSHLISTIILGGKYCDHSHKARLGEVKGVSQC